jgi:hypothetical protein
VNRPAPDPAERIRRVPLIGALGPERLAAALSVIVVAFAVLVVVLTRSIGGPPAGDPGAGGASPPSVGSPAPDGSDVVAPSVVAGSSAPGPAVSAPAASPAVTLPPTSAAWAGDARILLQADARLTAAREQLRAAVAAQPISTAAIRRELSSINATLTAVAPILRALEADGAPPDLVGDIRAVHQAALGTNLATLDASLQDAAAYRAGATTVADILDALDPLMARLANEAGLPLPSPS